ncbi:hypothetical protein Tsubulata_001819 [Turnera subulata]|uniref:NAD(P)-binding domain-containing protein n=1 Tax=Turnera subulata TaxID=218843 RepID=A0A9Q0G4W8_9ROSI|nr:hypothetical protein Tsubulata_001819 [Turnera subulata]
MAPTLTSNSFLLTTTPSQSRRRVSFKNPRLTTVSAKKAEPFSFQLGKPKKGDADDDGKGKEKGKGSSSSPFSFDVSSLTSLVPAGMSNPASSGGLSFGNTRRKDPGTVFVAGATGQAGIRIAQTLLRQGFRVRAGVPELSAAQELARLALEYKIISKEESRRLNAVESTFEDKEEIAKAIGNASKVVVTIGPTENGPISEVSTLDALQVVEAAQLAGVGHVAIIYDGNAAGASSTGNVLDGIQSFFNNLFSQPQLTVPEFLQKVIETDVNYTFIKTSLTGDFSPEISYNVVVSAEGNGGTSDYKVTTARIASVVAEIFSNVAVAENKVVELFTDPSAPLKPLDELFSAIPEDERRKTFAEALAKAKAEEEAKAAAQKAVEAAQAAKKLGDEVKKLSEQEAKAASLAEEAQEKAGAAGASVEDILSRARAISSGFSWEKFSSQISTAVQQTEVGKPKVQIATVRGQAKARSLPSQKAVVKPPTPKPRSSRPKEEPKSKPKEEGKAEVRKMFGGLFKQETIYVDDD